MPKRVLLTIAALLAGAPATAQSPSVAAPEIAGIAAKAARAHVAAQGATILSELAELLRLPNVAQDSVDIERNAQLLVSLLEARDIHARMLRSPGSPPAVFGEILSPGATRTIIFYAHYDGQPVRPEEWTSDPWTPTLRDGALPHGRVIELPAGEAFPPGSSEWRLFARSASDDKGPIVAMLSAVDALRAAGIEPAANMKFFFDGEEEAGDDHLREMLEAHRELLSADVWIFADGPAHQTRRPQIVYGVRGVMGLELTVYGPARALHSGHYGNWAPNPAARLTRLLASMRDDAGNVTIDGFEDAVRPLSQAELRALADAPAVDSVLLDELGLAAPEGPGLLNGRIMRPALNIRGLSSGGVGERASNAVPIEARASIDIRLVPDQRPTDVREQIEAHIRRQGYFITHDEPTAQERGTHERIVRVEWDGGYAAMRTPMDLPVAREIATLVDAATDAALVHTPMLGGSLPLSTFEEVLRLPLVTVPIVNHDNNQHAANENLRLQNLWDGIAIYAAVMAGFGATR